MVGSKPPLTAAEANKSATIKKNVQIKRDQMSRTMQQKQFDKLGPGSYQNDDNLNLIGRLRTSNSVKGFGNGFISRAERGLTKSVLLNQEGLELLKGP